MLNLLVEFAEDVQSPPTTPQKTTIIPRSTVKPSTSTWQQGNRVQFISNNSHSTGRQSTIRSSGNCREKWSKYTSYNVILLMNSIQVYLCCRAGPLLWFSWPSPSCYCYELNVIMRRRTVSVLSLQDLYLKKEREKPQFNLRLNAHRWHFGQKRQEIPYFSIICLLDILSDCLFVNINDLLPENSVYMPERDVYSSPISLLTREMRLGNKCGTKKISHVLSGTAVQRDGHTNGRTNRKKDNTF